jgi:hypothetical protein
MSMRRKRYKAYIFDLNISKPESTVRRHKKAKTVEISVISNDSQQQNIIRDRITTVSNNNNNNKNQYSDNVLYCQLCKHLITDPQIWADRSGVEMCEEYKILTAAYCKNFYRLIFIDHNQN